MTDDVIRRLRDADPCANDSVTGGVRQAEIDAIVASDRDPSSSATWLEVGPRSAPVRRRSRVAGVAAVVAVVAALLVAVVVVVRGQSAPPSAPAVSSADSGSERFSAAGVTFEHPTRWKSYPYPLLGDGTVVLTYLSTVPVAAPCTPLGSGKALPTDCFDPVPTTLAGGGVFVTWSFENLGHSVQDTTGVDTTLGGRIARVDEGVGNAWCPGTGAVRSVRANIALPTQGQLLLVTSCIGPGDVDADLAAVRRMLASVQVER